MRIFKGIVWGILISLISMLLIALEIVFYYWGNSKILESLTKYQFVFDMNIIQSIINAFILVLSFVGMFLYAVLPTCIVIFVACYMAMFLYDLFFVYKIRITRE